MLQSEIHQDILKIQSIRAQIHWSMNDTQRIFTNRILYPKLFLKIIPVSSFIKNPTSGLVADNGPQTDRPNALYFYFVKYG